MEMNVVVDDVFARALVAAVSGAVEFKLALADEALAGVRVRDSHEKPQTSCAGNAGTRRRDWAMMSYSTTTTGFPSTSIFGAMPRPGAVLAAIKPFTRCGAPSAVETVT